MTELLSNYAVKGWKRATRATTSNFSKRLVLLSARATWPELCRVAVGLFCSKSLEKLRPLLAGYKLSRGSNIIRHATRGNSEWSPDRYSENWTVEIRTSPETLRIFLVICIYYCFGEQSLFFTRTSWNSLYDFSSSFYRILNVRVRRQKFEKFEHFFIYECL